MLALLGRIAAWCAGFFEISAPQSMSRLVALLLALDIAPLVAAATYVAVKQTTPAETIRAIAVIIGVLLTSGVVALLVRPRPGAPPPPPSDPS